MTKIFYQLYSGRNYGDMSKLLTDIIHIGYEGVEPYGAFYKENFEDLKKAIDAKSTQSISGHFALDLVLNRPNEAINMAKKLGMKYVIIPFVSEEDRASWDDLAKKIEAIVPKYKEEGLFLGYHNHDFEFFPDKSGAMPMEILLEKAPSLVWEIDMAWVVKADQDPMKWIKKYQDRIKLIHVKDIAKEGECIDEGGWADAGKGMMKWKEIFEELGTSFVDIWIMEHDNPSDILRHAKNSYEFVNEIFNK